MRSKPKPLKNYTVILLYPDFIASNYGQETFIEYTMARNPAQAIRFAQKRKALISGGATEDWFCIACFAGKLIDRNPNGV